MYTALLANMPVKQYQSSSQQLACLNMMLILQPAELSHVPALFDSRLQLHDRTLWQQKGQSRSRHSRIRGPKLKVDGYACTCLVVRLEAHHTTTLSLLVTEASRTCTYKDLVYDLRIQIMGCSGAQLRPCASASRASDTSRAPWPSLLPPFPWRRLASSLSRKRSSSPPSE